MTDERLTLVSEMLHLYLVSSCRGVCASDTITAMTRRIESYARR